MQVGRFRSTWSHVYTHSSAFLEGLSRSDQSNMAQGIRRFWRETCVMWYRALLADVVQPCTVSFSRARARASALPAHSNPQSWARKSAVLGVRTVATVARERRLIKEVLPSLARCARRKSSQHVGINELPSKHSVQMFNQRSRNLQPLCLTGLIGTAG